MRTSDEFVLLQGSCARSGIWILLSKTAMCTLNVDAASICGPVLKNACTGHLRRARDTEPAQETVRAWHTFVRGQLQQEMSASIALVFTDVMLGMGAGQGCATSRCGLQAATLRRAAARKLWKAGDQRCFSTSCGEGSLGIMKMTRMGCTAQRGGVTSAISIALTPSAHTSTCPHAEQPSAAMMLPYSFDCFLFRLLKSQMRPA